MNTISKTWGGQAEPFENGCLRENVIFNADCIDGMSHMPDKSVDLIVTDPPYLIIIEAIGVLLKKNSIGFKMTTMQNRLFRVL